MTATLTPPRKAWLGLALLALPTVLVALDFNVLFLALPQLTADLHASGVQQLWISDLYGLMVAVLALVMGAVGDRIGRRRLLMIGSSVFAAAAVLAAYAPDPDILMLARVVQGAGGATLMPSTLALIGALFPDTASRGRAIAIWATCQFAGGALGPVFGGLLLHWFWWGSVFLIAVPICAAVVVLGPALLPEQHAPEHAATIDVRSCLLLTSTLSLLLFTVKTAIPSGHQPWPVVLTAGVLAVVTGVAFTARQLRSADPFLDLALLRAPSIRALILGLVLAGVAMAGVGLWTTQYLQSVLGLSPLSAASVFAPMGLGVAAGTLITPRLARRWEPAQVITGGLLVAAAGCALLVAVRSGGPLPVLVGAYTILALGTGPLFALGTAQIVSTAPAARAGRAAGLSETSNYVGGTFGIAVIGTLGSTLYSHLLARHDLAFLSGSQRSTALQNMAGARAVSRAAGPLGPALAHATADSATTALHAVGVAGLIAFVISAGAVWRTRNAAGSGEATVEAADPAMSPSLAGSQRRLTTAGAVTSELVTAPARGRRLNSMINASPASRARLFIRRAVAPEARTSATLRPVDHGCPLPGMRPATGPGHREELAPYPTAPNHDRFRRRTSPGRNEENDRTFVP